MTAPDAEPDDRDPASHSASLLRASGLRPGRRAVVAALACSGCQCPTVRESESDMNLEVTAAPVRLRAKIHWQGGHESPPDKLRIRKFGTQDPAGTDSDSEPAGFCLCSFASN